MEVCIAKPLAIKASKIDEDQLRDIIRNHPGRNKCHHLKLMLIAGGRVELFVSVPRDEFFLKGSSDDISAVLGA